MSSTTASGLTPEEIKQIAQAKKEYNEAFMNGSPTMQDEAREYFDTVLDIILKKLGGGTDIPGPLPGCGANPDPNNEHVKEGGWGGDTAAAATWDAVPMKDDPALWKVVDAAGKNIAHKFASEADAEKFITYHRCKQETGAPDPIPPGPEPEPPTPTPGDASYPYPAIGSPMQSTQRGPTTRHYSSGKADDKTIEKNVKNIKFDNYQFVTYVTMNSVEHDDNVSLKLGGTHMGSGWFDHGVSFSSNASTQSQTCLGTEKKHPSTQSCVIKGPKIPQILGKKMGIAATYFKKTNHTELWTNDGSGWKKQVEGDNVNNFNPKSANNEAQLRIDGFKDVPTIHSAVVTEIAGP